MALENRESCSSVFHTCAIFRAVFDSRSWFFAPKPHGNACYAGYKNLSKQENQFLCAQKPTCSRHYKTFLVKMNFLASPFNLSIRPALGVTREEILDDGAGEGNRDSIETERLFLSFRSLPFRFSLYFPRKHLILRLQPFPAG